MDTDEARDFDYDDDYDYDDHDDDERIYEEAMPSQFAAPSCSLYQNLDELNNTKHSNGTLNLRGHTYHPHVQSTKYFCV